MDRVGRGLAKENSDGRFAASLFFFATRRPACA
jgi:hypothetical protein